MLIELKEPVRRRRRRGSGDYRRSDSIADAVDNLRELLYFAGDIKKEEKKEDKKKPMFEFAHVVLILGILSPIVGLAFTAYVFNIALAVATHIK